MSAELVSRILQIVLIDLVLSGDNALVIGLAAHPLPRRQRRMAIFIGGASAIVLRMLLTGLAAVLLGWPGLKAVGGVLLLWIAFNLLAREEEPRRGIKAASSLRGAIVTILVADLIMSLDNVLGVAAASNGDLLLLLFGLGVSMAIVMLGGAMFAELIDRLWWFVYLGAAVVAWTGVDMVQEDGVVAQAGELPLGLRLAVNVVVTLAVVALAHRGHRRVSQSRRSPG